MEQHAEKEIITKPQAIGYAVAAGATLGAGVGAAGTKLTAEVCTTKSEDISPCISQAQENALIGGGATGLSLGLVATGVVAVSWIKKKL